MGEEREWRGTKRRKSREGVSKEMREEGMKRREEKWTGMVGGRREKERGNGIRGRRGKGERKRNEGRKGKGKERGRGEGSNLHLY